MRTKTGASSLTVSSLVLLLTVLSSFLSNVLSGTLLVPTSCRPPLPINWFINTFQSQPSFSADLTAKFANASASLSAIIGSTLSQLNNTESVSVMVGSPWGTVYEHNNGKLRRNDTDDERMVDHTSMYRIGSITKVPSNPFFLLAIF